MEVGHMDPSSLKTPAARFKEKQNTGTQSPCLNMPASPFLETLGYGTGVSVYLLERSPRHGAYRSPWAVKKINKTNRSSDIYSKRLKEEAKILKTLRHENIIGFRALKKAEDGTLCLALEDAEKSLFSIIENRMESDLGALPSCDIMKVALGISDALAYLHNEKNLLHGDIKSGNILIKGNFEIAKLCDFGVAVKLDENLKAPSAQYIGTESWSAKEALHGQDGFVTDKSDIYSYGLVIYETLTLNIPHFDIFPVEEDFDTEEEYEAAFEEAECNYSSRLGGISFAVLATARENIKFCYSQEILRVTEFFKILFAGTRPLLPHSTFGKSYEDPISLFFACTDEIPNRRPSAKQIVTSVRSRGTMYDIRCRLDFNRS